ncbi:quinone oxidoreductase family protein [Rhizobium ruizarguesonis]|uniref:quinone oxidoreductase family protein n=1 Tax=Rhizobium TaxID=379 RepID=UPI0013BF4E88|nr:quinone oxidoreductase [Rhizobium ruizarguesonis]MBY5828601.1 quinone oxidoreductase [Rhizobium leguminosarum]MBY5856338.1 quinone oxidoreductase [Rhizobium leguminosarum]NEI96521.1 zinc-binding dehydrogenase [Rhizobium ruizarguesonis]NEJ33856.1 zinc-binding dehydrogenase [Rhizobium ruizarguesonis]
MARQIRISQNGEPDVMQLHQGQLQALGADEVLVRHLAVGINFIDIVQRRTPGLLDLPSGLGHDAVGQVESVGANVTDFAAGDIVAYIGAGPGAYADLRIVKSEKLAPVPAGTDPNQLAALLFKGLTAQYLLRRTARVGRDDTILIHAAAGGVGFLMSQWARRLGATVVGSVGSEDKLDQALAQGCHYAINYARADWPQQLLKQTGGIAPTVVYDSIGKTTFLDSLSVAAPFATVVVFGMASGPAPAIDPEVLNKKGCLFLTRPSVFAHNATAEMFRHNVVDLLDAEKSGSLSMPVGNIYRLEDVTSAHQDAEARRMPLGSIICPTP